MAVYNYIARDNTNARFAGTYRDVQSAAELREQLAKMGYTLLSAKKQKIRKPRRERVKPADVAQFAYKLAGMVGTGLSIIRCLETIEEQTDNSTFRYIICDVRENIETGASLREAFGRHPKIFNDFFLGMIEAGEHSGKIGHTLEICAGYLEKQLEIRRKVQSAFAYPTVVGIMALGVVSALVIFIVPTFSNLYQKLHVPLPGPTRMLVFVSDAARHYSWILMLIIAGLLIFSKKIAASRRIKIRWDFLKLHLPMFARLNRMVVVARFIRTFAMLTSMGVPMLDALRVAARVADNTLFTDISEQIQQSIQSGNTVASSFRVHEIFPPIIIQLASSGEEAGVLAEMLNKGVDILEKDINRTISSLLVKLEPMLTMIMGLVVGSILLAVYLPMFDYMAHLQ